MEKFISFGAGALADAAKRRDRDARPIKAVGARIDGEAASALLQARRAAMREFPPQLAPAHEVSTPKAPQSVFHFWAYRVHGQD